MKLDELIAGDTLDFLDSVPDYPPSDAWTLKYRLTPRFASPSQTPIDITASTSGDSYRVQAAAGITVTWTPGYYTWTRWVEKAGPIRQSLGEGQINVKSNPALLAQGYDGRSHAQKVLDAIEACMEARATTTQRELVAFTIGVRSQSFDVEDSRAELVKLRSTYMWYVDNEKARERIASGLSNPRNVGIRFGGS